MPDLWAGIDAGKAHQHCLLIDNEGNRLLSRKVANDETALLKLITDVMVKAAVPPHEVHNPGRHPPGR